jgi:hypothetical protein
MDCGVERVILPLPGKTTVLIYRVARMAGVPAIPLRLIACPTCPKCGARMELARIFPDRPGYDQRTYECPKCEYELTELVRFE